MALQLSHGSLIVNGNSLPFFSGEIHYWRNDPTYWREALIMAKLNGLNFVSTYIPWDFHEINEGYCDLNSPLSYDFTGRTDPRRNLVGFIELAQREGLYVVVRPGPVIIAEWQHKGPALHSFAFDWPDPRYVSALERWYDAVTAVIRRYQVDQGGPIVLCQVDNEGHELTVEGAVMYFTHRYGNAEAFNARYGTGYPTLQAAAEDLCITGPHNVLQTYVLRFNTENADLKAEFLTAKHWFHVQMIEHYVAMLRQRGVTVPLSLNSNGTPDSHDYLGMQRVLDFMTLDLYPPHMVTPAYHGSVENACKYLASTSPWPVSVEFPGSSFTRAWYIKLGPVNGTHIQRCGVIEAASGVQGFNYYMFMDRDMCSRSPLTETAKPSDAYFATFHLHRALLRAGFPATQPQQRVALCWSHARSSSMHSTVPNLDWQEMRSFRPDCNPLHGYAGLCNALIERDVDFGVVDVKNEAALDRFALLLLAGSETIGREEYDRLQGLGSRVVWVGQAPTTSNQGEALPAPAGRVVQSLEEIDPTLLYAIRVDAPGVRSYLHTLGDDRVVFLVNLGSEPRTVNLQEVDLSGDVIDCWECTNLGPAEGQRYTVPGDGWRILRITTNPEATAGVTRVEREYF
ncbi:MAG: beta-galactosidase [Armatimonadota bacterium]